MRIGLVAENYYPTLGGIQEHVYHLAHWLNERGHHVRILTGEPDVAQKMGPPDDPWVVRVGRSKQYGVMGTYSQATIGPVIARRFCRALRDNQFDLLHLHGPCDIGLPLLAHTFYRGPKVATLHSAFGHGPGRALMAPYYKWVMEGLTGVIAVSELAASVMSRYADFKYKVIPNGVDTEAFARGRRMARFDDGRLNVLYVGRIEPRNGLDLLIRAFPRVLHQFPNARLLIAGGGPQEEEARSLVPHSLKDHFVFLGPVYEERADLYASADLFVLPARKGGTFSIMILEALASGVPVVATPIVPPHQRNSHWEPVSVAEGHEPEDIAAAILKSLSSDNHERIERGLNLVKEYDWSRVGGRIFDYYRATLASHHA